MHRVTLESLVSCFKWFSFYLSHADLGIPLDGGGLGLAWKRNGERESLRPGEIHEMALGRGRGGDIMRRLQLSEGG